MNRFLLFAASALLTINSYAQTEVTSYKPGVTTDGITYFLPNTCIRIVVNATKKHHTPGEFCEYADRYLHLKDVPQTPYDEWNINNIQLVAYGTADKNKAYNIKLKQKTSAPLVKLTPDGRLLSVNSVACDKEPVLPMPSITPNKEKIIKGEDFKTEEILSAGSTSKMAELTANEIYDIRENRGLLTKGQADFMPKDGEQLKLMLANLDTQEEGLLQLFKGSTTSETHVFAFDITPTANIEKQIVFNFSKYLGIVDNDDPAGIPYYISVKDLQTLPAANTNAKAKQKDSNEDLKYNIPSNAKITIFTDQKEIVAQQIPMAQFGRVENLGGELFNKKNTTHVQLSPVTGNISKIEAARPE